MKLSISNNIKFLFVIILFLATISSQAMEQQEASILSEDNQILDQNTVVNRICNAFNKRIDEGCIAAEPQKFYEAVSRLQYIVRLLERSEIELRENFILTQEACVINNKNISHTLLHPIFNQWFQTSCKTTLLSNPKSVQAINIILERLSKNVSPENLEQYHKAINSLPTLVAQHIKKQFITMHGWPHNFKPFIAFDDHGKIIAANVANETVHIYSQPHNWVRAERIISNEEKRLGIYSAGSSTYINGSTHEAFEHEGLEHGLLQMQESGVYKPLWQKPTFEQALKRQAHENIQPRPKEERCVIS